jgi:predicted HTH transcriptional regulator
MVAKAVAGLLNNQGGTVLIGVQDNHTVCGIERDWATLGKQDQDGFGQKVIETISEFLGPEFADLFHIAFESSNEKIVCRVSVRASPSPVFLKGEEGREFYVRAHNTTRRLDSQATHNYIRRHWRERDGSV